jgi:vacuolar protein sorting-associated protein 1
MEEALRLVACINSIQELCIDMPYLLELPQIIVVGGQSSGKSSVLENIIGEDILPRGPEMVTRRPLIVQITNESVSGEGKGTGGGSEQSSPGGGVNYCMFGHIPGKRYTDMEEVKREIERETDRLVGNKRDVSQIPILLKVSSNTRLPLTLIDLPGLVKVPSEGQPADICAKIEEISRDYAKNKNSIILAVTPASTDITGSDGLMLAREVDPKMDRTLCVLTKMDLIDPGSDVLNVLAGRVVKVRLGFVPVVCRGHAAVETRLSIGEALGKEKAFFGNSVYKERARFCGVPYLMERLYKVLQERIKLSLPSLRTRIEGSLASARRERVFLGEEVCYTRGFSVKQAEELRMDVEEKMRGGEVSLSEVLGGARISYALNILYPAFVDAFAPAKITEAEIRVAMLNLGGSSGASSASEGFRWIVKREALRLRDDSLKLVNILETEVSLVLREVMKSSKARRFPNLSKTVSLAISVLFEKRYAAALSALHQFFEWNISRIAAPKAPRNASPEDEVELVGTFKKARRLESEVHLSLPEKIMAADLAEEGGPTHLVKEDLAVYMKRFKELVKDQVPKIVYVEVVEKALREMREVVLDAAAVDDLEWLLREEESICERRKDLSRRVELLSKASNSLQTLL